MFTSVALKFCLKIPKHSVDIMLTVKNAYSARDFTGTIFSKPYASCSLTTDHLTEELTNSRPHCCLTFAI